MRPVVEYLKKGLIHLCQGLYTDNKNDLYLVPYDHP